MALFADMLYPAAADIQTAYSKMSALKSVSASKFRDNTKRVRYLHLCACLYICKPSERAVLYLLFNSVSQQLSSLLQLLSFSFLCLRLPQSHFPFIEATLCLSLDQRNTHARMHAHRHKLIDLQWHSTPFPPCSVMMVAGALGGNICLIIILPASQPDSW